MCLIGAEITCTLFTQSNMSLICIEESCVLGAITSTCPGIAFMDRMLRCVICVCFAASRSHPWYARHIIGLFAKYTWNIPCIYPKHSWYILFTGLSGHYPTISALHWRPGCWLWRCFIHCWPRQHVDCAPTALLYMYSAPPTRNYSSPQQVWRRHCS